MESCQFQVRYYCHHNLCLDGTDHAAGSTLRRGHVKCSRHTMQLRPIGAVTFRRSRLFSAVTRELGKRDPTLAGKDSFLAKVTIIEKSDHVQYIHAYDRLKDSSEDLYPSDTDERQRDEQTERRETLRTPTAPLGA